MQWQSPRRQMKNFVAKNGVLMELLRRVKWRKKEPLFSSQSRSLLQLQVQMTAEVVLSTESSSVMDYEDNIVACCDGSPVQVVNDVVARAAGGAGCQKATSERGSQ